MPIIRTQKGKRSTSPRKKRPNRPGLDHSLYSAEGYVSWLAKAKKARKRKRN